MEGTQSPCIVSYEALMNTKSDEIAANREHAEILGDKIGFEVECQPKVSIPEGRRKSGKFWKTNKHKASSMVKTRGLRDTWEKKEKLRQDLKRVKEKSRELKQQRIDEKEAKKQRRRENLKRQEANRLKSEVVQVIKNPNKIKRMKKKQLRNVEKRDTTKVEK